MFNTLPFGPGHRGAATGLRPPDRRPHILAAVCARSARLYGVLRVSRITGLLQFGEGKLSGLAVLVSLPVG